MCNIAEVELARIRPPHPKPERVSPSANPPCGPLCAQSNSMGSGENRPFCYGSACTASRVLLRSWTRSAWSPGLGRGPWLTYAEAGWQGHYTTAGGSRLAMRLCLLASRGQGFGLLICSQGPVIPSAHPFAVSATDSAAIPAAGRFCIAPNCGIMGSHQLREVWRMGQQRVSPD